VYLETSITAGAIGL